MIYSKFGSPLALISKRQQNGDQLSIQATVGDAPEVREYRISDMNADGGIAEIDQAIAQLPWAVPVGKKAHRQQLRF